MADNNIFKEKTPLILIVDDVARNLQVLGTILSKENYKIAAANNAIFSAFSHNVGLIFSSCISISGAGKVHSFNESTSSFADSIVKFPSICAVPQHIFACIVGAVSSFPHTNIAICVQIFFSDILQNIHFQASSRFIITTGSHTCDVLVFAYLK